MTPTETTETTELQTTATPEPAAETHEHTHDHEPHVHEPQPTLNPELMREIEVSVDADTVSKAFKTVVKKYQRLARIPGFRVGKVPESVIKSRFAKDVRQEVLDELVSARFRTAIEEQKLNPVSQPQLTNLLLVDGQPLQFKAAFEVLPEIDITGYDTIAVEKPEVALTEDEFEAEMTRAMENHGTVETVEDEREIVDGDWAEIEFKGIIQDTAQVVGEDGVENTSQQEPIVGEDVLIEVGGKNTLAAFSDALRGQKVGQEMQFEVTYPADFGEPRLAGQTVKYDVTLKAIKKKTFPEKDDELAKLMGDYESWSDFETKLRGMAEGRKKDALIGQAREKMLEELIAKFQFPVPESFVQQQIDARLDRGLRALAQQGMSADDMRKLDFNRLREAQRDQAIAEVKASLLLDKIAETENVEVTNDELERELLIASIQAREPFEALRERMAKDGSIDRMREQMRREKTGNALYEKLAG
ncbi:trigger factor [Granulicella sp. WH15]|uniref:trigger factor n=1 Tax=Granulicella sp. WH15 TaxID=2602070 RepID=UPI0021037CFA|nr:trigger factor [Granulicella sp. WH15]